MGDARIVNISHGVGKTLHVREFEDVQEFLSFRAFPFTSQQSALDNSGTPIPTR